MPYGLVAITPISSVSYSNIFKNSTTFSASIPTYWANNSAGGWHSVLAAVIAFCSTSHSSSTPSPHHTHTVGGWYMSVCFLKWGTLVYSLRKYEFQEYTFHLVFVVYTHTSGNSLKSGRWFWSFQWKPITWERQTQYSLRSQSWCGSRNKSSTR